MTKSRIAEWILSQVLPPDRAASTVGDWMEDVDERGNIWFCPASSEQPSRVFGAHGGTFKLAGGLPGDHAATS